MKAHGPKTLANAPPEKGGLRVEVDFERYAPLLEDADISEDQKRDLLQALWSIIIGFVDLGFEVDCEQTACGQVPENSRKAPLTAPDALHSTHSKLIEDFIAAHRDKEAAE